jgi:hypothetical protein
MCGYVPQLRGMKSVSLHDPFRGAAECCASVQLLHHKLIGNPGADMGRGQYLIEQCCDWPDCLRMWLDKSMRTLSLLTTVSESGGSVVLSSLRMDFKNTIDVQIPFSPAFVAYASLHVPYINRLANNAQR